MKILLVGPTFPPMGGIARICEDFLTFSAKDNSVEMEIHDVKIPEKFRSRAHTHLRTTNYFIRDGFFNTCRQIFFAICKYCLFVHQIINFKPNVIHIISCTGWGYWRNIIYILVCRMFRRKKIIFHIVGEIDSFYAMGGNARRFFIIQSLKLPSSIVVQSEGIALIVKQMTKRRVTAVSNGLNFQQFPDFSLEDKLNFSHSFSIITLGFLGKRKGHFDLIEVAKILRQKNLLIKFYFIGGGEVEKFRSLIQELGLADTIEVCGMLNDNKKNELMLYGTIYILPSYAEGQPLSILEGMYFAMPIISTNVGAIPEVIHSNNGFIINPGDVNTMANYIEKIYYDATLLKEISTQNYRVARELYSFTRFYHDFKLIYQS